MGRNALRGLVMAAVVGAMGTSGFAVQFQTLAPGYTQEIYVGPLISGTDGPGMAWTTAGNMLRRTGNVIDEYDLTQTASHLGTPLHGLNTQHTINTLPTTGFGMTNGLDGKIYTITQSGLYQIDPSSWTAVLMPGSAAGLYGMTTLPDGRIAYSDNSGASNVYIYDPVALTNTYIFTATYQIDGMISGPTGNLALADHTTKGIEVITNTGTSVNYFHTNHFPDGLAFAASASLSQIYSNNNDGTITRYDLAPGYLGVPVQTDIATQTLGNAYGDLASIGPDCAFYVSQYENGNSNGSNAGVGTHWDNGTTNNEASIVRIAFTTGGGSGLPGDDPVEVCTFYTPFDHDNPSPEPGTLGVLAMGGLALLRRRQVN